MPFITGYISNKIQNIYIIIIFQCPLSRATFQIFAKLVNVYMQVFKFQCPLSRATFQTNSEHLYNNHGFVSMPFITGYISNGALWLYKFKRNVSRLFITGYISNLALGMPLFTRFKSHFAGESKFFPATYHFTLKCATNPVNTSIVANFVFVKTYLTKIIL